MIEARNDQLIRKRIEKGLSSQELAKKAKMSTAALIRIEKGQANPWPRTAKKIADALEVEFNEVFIIKN